MPDTQPTAPRGVALTLSGGGFRATLFHLGVVRFLREAGELVRVTHITSVSGGSILAAHLVLNWERYTGTDEQFAAAAAEVVEFTRWDLRGRVIRPWLASGAALWLPRLVGRKGWWRTELLQRGYDRLFRVPTGTATRPAKLGDLPGPNRPELHILTTSMSAGKIASFGRGRFTLNDDPRLEQPAHRLLDIAADHVPVSLAVAASSACPPFFPSIKVDHATFGVASHEFPHPHYLADGGVFDNLGIRKLMWLSGAVKPAFALYVVSDAQRAFTADHECEYGFLLSQAGRTVDLLMDRVSGFETEALLARAGVDQSRVVHCRLLDEVSGDRADALSAPAQSAVRNVRTDLDAFDPPEVNAVVRQGTSVARLRYDQNAVTPAAPAAPTTPWQPLPTGDPNGVTVDGVSRRRVGLWRPAHAARWALLGLAVLYFVAVPGFLVGRNIVETRRANAEAELREQEEKEKKKAQDEKDAAEKKLREEQEARKQAEEAARAAEQLENEHATFHVQTKLTLLRTLGSLASATKELWTVEKENWNDLVARLRVLKDVDGTDDTWFINYLTRPRGDNEDQPSYLERIETETKKEQPSDELLKVTYQIASDLKQYFVGNQTNQGRYYKLIQPYKAHMYRDAVKLAKRMTEDRFKTLNELQTTRGQFWALYWGEMVLVEKDEVRDAMKVIGQLLKEWEQSKDGIASKELKAKLVTAAAALKTACENELKGQ